mmetsp:Transcript_28308/g.52224  ORF Transcript_28308/g.52224 Transcript_28308/m.52224 type:complete len:250 (+) Transcript_28308:3-752(+)
MKDEQAAWLMTWLEHQAHMNSATQLSDVENALLVLEGLVETITEHLRTVKLNVAVCTSKLRHVTKGAPPPNMADDESNGSMRRRSRSYSPPRASPPASTMASRENSRLPDHSAEFARSEKRTTTTATVIPLDANGRKISLVSSEATEVTLPDKGRRNSKTNSKQKPGTMQNPAQEHVDSMTIKLGSAVQDLQWQITGAVERLAHQADEFMTCADGQPQAPVTTAQMDELNGISMASSQIASRESSRRLS